MAAAGVFMMTAYNLVTFWHSYGAYGPQDSYLFDTSAFQRTHSVSICPSRTKLLSENFDCEQSGPWLGAQSVSSCFNKCPDGFIHSDDMNCKCTELGCNALRFPKDGLSIFGARSSPDSPQVASGINRCAPSTTQLAMDVQCNPERGWLGIRSLAACASECPNGFVHGGKGENVRCRCLDDPFECERTPHDSMAIYVVNSVVGAPKITEGRCPRSTIQNSLPFCDSNQMQYSKINHSLSVVECTEICSTEGAFVYSEADIYLKADSVCKCVGNPSCHPRNEVLHIISKDDTNTAGLAIEYFKAVKQTSIEPSWGSLSGCEKVAQIVCNTWGNVAYKSLMCFQWTAGKPVEYYNGETLFSVQKKCGIPWWPGIKEEKGMDPEFAARINAVREYLNEAIGGKAVKPGAALFEMHDQPRAESHVIDALGHMGIPVLSWSGLIATRSQSMASIQENPLRTTVLFPDLYFLTTRGYTQDRSGKHPNPIQMLLLESRKHPWNLKKRKAVFRGSSTGHAPQDRSIDQIRRNDRLSLALSSKNKTYLDAGPVNTVQITNQQALDEIAKLGLIKSGWMEFEDMIQYRGIIDVDGNANSWAGFAYKLFANSAVLKVTSAAYEQWFYEELVPCLHYLPVAHDMSDLAEMASLVTHPTQDQDIELRVMVANMQRWAHDPKSAMSYDTLLRNTTIFLHKVGELQASLYE